MDQRAEANNFSDVIQIYFWVLTMLLTRGRVKEKISGVCTSKLFDLDVWNASPFQFGRLVTSEVSFLDVFISSLKSLNSLLKCDP